MISLTSLNAWEIYDLVIGKENISAGFFDLYSLDHFLKWVSSHSFGLSHLEIIFQSNESENR